MGNLDKLAALKAARAAGGQNRLKSYKAADDDIYDELTEIEYKEIVGNRLAKDDFIEDDDGMGMYVDNGMDEEIGRKGRRRAGGSDGEESESEEEYEGASYQRSTSTSKSTSSKSKQSGNPNGKKLMNSKQQRPKQVPQAPSAYRPQVSAAQEADFMASLMKTVDEPEEHLSLSVDGMKSALVGGRDEHARRKRKSSPEYGHSNMDGEGDDLDIFAEEGNVPTSDSWIEEADNGIAEDVGPWEMRDRQNQNGHKKPRTGRGVTFKAEADVSMMDEGHAMDVDIEDGGAWDDSDEVMVKREEEEEEEERLETRSGVAPATAARTFTSAKARLLGLRGAKPGSSSTSALPSTETIIPKPRTTVNASSVSSKTIAAAAQQAQQAQEAARAKADALASEVAVKQEAAAKTKKNWMSVQAGLNTGTGEEEPLGSPFTEAAARAKTYTPLLRMDAFEKDAQGNTTKKNAYGEEVSTLRMYWLDYTEENGVVHLIGKVLDRNSGKYVSACVSVTGMQRNLFVLPRARRMDGSFETDLDVTAVDVHQELDEVRRKHNIQGRFAMKPVQRKYAFELPDVPKGESQWYKIVYGFNEPRLPEDATGATFSKIFGTNTSAFELLVIKRKIMGPCWLEIKDCVSLGPKDKPASWCRLEVRVEDPKNVNPISDSDPSAPKDMPPLTVMSLATRTIVNHKQNTQELLAVTASVWEGYNIEDPTPVEKLFHTPYTFVRPLGSDKYPPGFEVKARSQRNMTILKDERSLLNSALSLFQRVDPDIIVGHEFLGSTAEVLLQRMKLNNVDHWSRIGRFRRKQLVVGKKAWSNSIKFSGRLVADLSGDGAKGMIDSVSWSLTEMFQTQLGIAREEIDPDDTAGYFDPYAIGPDRMFHFIRHLQMDAFGQMAICSKVQYLPLTKQLTSLAGNSWNRTMTGARAERNEYILLHEFHRLKYICPDKGAGKAPARVAKSAAATRKTESGAAGAEGEGAPEAKKTTYQGGLVFHPKKGLWETHVLVMDFNSLYPSIIQEYNIDFTTVERDNLEDVMENAIPEVPPSEASQGVLPRLIATLVGRRKQVKGLMKDKSAGQVKLLQWDIKQKALKLTANSMYGCLGFDGSRFYARPLAALTTFKGREILTRTKEMAENMGLDVVYGDTDSVFVNSNKTEYSEAIKIANEFKRHVNEQYKLLEIDLDAVFARLLLLQKKKYAALKVGEDGKTAKLEIKGLDMVRREFCKLSKDVSRYVLDQIMSGKVTEDVVSELHDYLTLVGNNLREKRVELDDLVIFKRLGKNPEDYPDKGSQPHVQVALRMNAKGGSAKAGDVIPYVFCMNPDGKAARSGRAENAYHPDDLRRAGSTLQVDNEYYLSVQLLPPIQRLCEEIEGTDKARLAECLGLNPQHYQQTTSLASDSKDFTTLQSQISDKERFRSSDPFKVRCRACKTESLYSTIADDFEKNKLIQILGVTCPCGHVFSRASVQVQVENAVRAHIAKYYEASLCCSECGEKTRSMSVYGRRCVSKPGCRGEMQVEYTDAMLYNQLLFYVSLFDTTKAMESVATSANKEELQAIAMHNQGLYSEISTMLNEYLDKCGRRYVDLTSLFSFMKKLAV